MIPIHPSACRKSSSVFIVFPVGLTRNSSPRSRSSCSGSGSCWPNDEVDMRILLDKIDLLVVGRLAKKGGLTGLGMTMLTQPVFHLRNLPRVIDIQPAPL